MGTTNPREKNLDLFEVAVTRAHEEIVGQIVHLIRSGQLKVGDRLPSVATLAEHTEVSKPVVGEAIRVLRERGVVESKRGVQGGVTVVSEDLPADLLRMRGWREATLTEVVEARRPIDVELALLAAERATEADMAEIRKALDDLIEAVKTTGHSFLRFDHRFHYLISRAARSELLAHFQHRALCVIAVRLDEFKLYHENGDIVIKAHSDLFRAIEARDPAAIRQAVEFHWVTSAGSFASIDELRSP